MVFRLILIAALLAPSVVSAQRLTDDPTTATLADENADGTAAPWASGVSPDDRDAARALFAEGNRLLGDAMFLRAIDAYRRALARWDHPAIQYNLALALINVDDPISLYDALVNATAHGPAAIGGDRFERAKDYQLLVAQQLGVLELTADQRDTRATVDNKEVLRGPGHWTGRVRAGKHVVVQYHGSILPLARTVFVGGGQIVRLPLRMYTEVGGPCPGPPPKWPYVAIGVGAGVIVATAAFHRSLDTLDALYGYVGGALAIAIGAVPIVHGVPLPPDCNPALDSASHPSVAIAPMLGRDHAGITAAVRF